jgi:hypothetical protein
MKIIYSISLLILSFSCFSQSKKEQIEILANRADSLNRVLNLTRNTYNQKEIEFKEQISSLHKKLEDLNTSLTKIKEELAKKENELKNSTQELLNKSMELTVLENRVIEKAKLIESLKVQVDELNTKQESLKKTGYIVFLRNGSLWKINFDGSQEELIFKDENIISFACSTNSIYYTKISIAGLEIHKLDKELKSSFVYLLKHKLQNQKPSIEDVNLYFNGNDDATMIFIEDNQLMIGANYSFEASSFKDYFLVDIIQKVYRICKEDDKSPRDLLEIKWINTTNRNHNFYSAKVGKEYELYLQQNNNPIQLTNTQQYSPRECWGEIVDNFDFFHTTTGKVLFKLVESCGDFAHYIVGLVNDDGTNQTIIEQNNILNTNDKQIVFSDTANCFIFLNEESELFIITGKDNRKIKLSSNVDGFKLFMAY